MAEVIAVWACILEEASMADPRGNPGTLDFEALDCSLGMEDGRALAIHQAMTARGLLDAAGGISSWLKRQPKREREDDTAAERKRAQRERDANGAPADVTPSHTTSHQKTPREEESREEEKKEDRAASPSFALPEWIPAEAWAGYVEMRGKKKGGAMTVRARNLKVAELQKFKDAGHDLGAILDKSTANGWTDIYEPKGNPSAKPESFV